MQEKILVIEDEKKIGDAIVYALKKEGYNVHVVYRGDEALRVLNDFHPDAIILDVMLPGMDGYEILKKIPDNDRIGIIMVTAKGDIVLSKSKRMVIAGDKQLDLTPKEFDTLALLLSNPGRVYTREQLLNLIWGMEYYGDTRTVDIHIQRVRKKLGEKYADLVQTVYGVGYKALGGSSED